MDEQSVRGLLTEVKIADEQLIGSRYLNKLLKVEEETKDTLLSETLKMWLYFYIGKMYFYRSNYFEAKKFLKLASELAQSMRQWISIQIFRAYILRETGNDEDYKIAEEILEDVLKRTEIKQQEYEVERTCVKYYKIMLNVLNFTRSDKLLHTFKLICSILKESRKNHDDRMLRRCYEESTIWSAVEEARRNKAVAARKILKNLLKEELLPVNRLKANLQILYIRAFKFKQYAAVKSELDGILSKNIDIEPNYIIIALLTNILCCLKTNKLKEAKEHKDHLEDIWNNAGELTKARFIKPYTELMVLGKWMTE